MTLDVFVAIARARVETGEYDCEGPALASHGPLRMDRRVLAELKLGSPTEGALGEDFHAILRAYRMGRPMGISVLTAGGPFRGTPHLLRQAHAAGIPTLAKDFIIHEQQLEHAAHNGASAVLLIERVLGERREDLVRYAHALGLQVVLEIDAPGMMDAVRGSAADIIGVNCRDLDTLQVDAARADRIVMALKQQGAKQPVLRLSGIHTATDARNACANGADGVLVGTALMRATEPTLTILSMKGPVAKVCGLQPDDLETAHGADLVGVVVASDSPRDVDPETAQQMFREIRAAGQTGVLVTRATTETAIALAKRLGPDVLQLHQTCDVDAVRAELRPFGIALLPAVTHPGAATPHLLDSHPRGGSGQPLTPRPAEESFLIAGGLDPDNVIAMLQATGAQGADASSGLESSPGRKDPALVRAFIDAVHATTITRPMNGGLLHV